MKLRADVLAAAAAGVVTLTACDATEPDDRVECDVRVTSVQQTIPPVDFDGDGLIVLCFEPQALGL